MTRYPTAQTQRARHLLNREALKRSHRRSELIRNLSDAEPEAIAMNAAAADKDAEHLPAIHRS